MANKGLRKCLIVGKATNPSGCERDLSLTWGPLAPQHQPITIFSKIWSASNKLIPCPTQTLTQTKMKKLSRVMAHGTPCYAPLLCHTADLALVGKEDSPGLAAQRRSSRRTITIVGKPYRSRSNNTIWTNLGKCGSCLDATVIGSTNNMMIIGSERFWFARNLDYKATYYAM